jgi:hypothetical protein
MAAVTAPQPWSRCRGAPPLRSSQTEMWLVVGHHLIAWRRHHSGAPAALLRRPRFEAGGPDRVSPRMEVADRRGPPKHPPATAFIRY